MARSKSILFLAVLMLAAWLIGQRLWTIHVERSAREAAAQAKAARAARLEPALATIHGWKTKPDQKCDDAALASRVTPGGVPWFAYTAESADGSVVETMAREPSHSERFDDTQLVAVLREHRGNPGRLAGTVLVLDLASGAPLCWTEVEGPTYGNDYRLDRLADGVHEISRVVSLGY